MSHPVIYVEWIDSESDHGWESFSDLEFDNTPVKSVGWLVKEDSAWICLAVCVTDNSCNPRISIPKRSVIRIVTLEIP